VDSIPATLENAPIVTAPATIGKLEAGGIAAAVATIPALLVAIPVAVRSFGGGGISPDAPLSVRVASAVMLMAPLLLVTVTVAVSLAARRLGVRVGTTAAVRLTPTALALAAATAISFSLLTVPKDIFFAFGCWQCRLSPVFSRNPRFCSSGSAPSSSALL
jgi:hypothetical protein